VRNPEAGLWSDEERWRIIEDLRIGTPDAEGPDQFSSVAAIGVSPSGRIHVADGASRTIRVFDRSGTYIHTIGHQGSGPGEFRSISGMVWDSLGRLWVSDPGNARYALYDSAGVHTGDRPMRTPGAVYPWLGGLGRDGFLYDAAGRGGPGGEVRFSYFRADTSTGELIDSLPRFGGRPPQAAAFPMLFFPFMPRLTFRFDPRGYVWFGSTGEYRIVQLDMGGDTIRIIERPFSAPPVTAAEHDSIARELALLPPDPVAPVSLRDIPSTKPVFDRIYVDGVGHLIIQINGTVDEQGRRFDVFDVEGRFLGTAESDVAFSSLPAPPVFTGSFVYGVTTDALGVQYVVRGRITREPNQSGS